jgi:Txe/YoeB family toxin of Txe-Axe toxin-antitoxin module
MKKYIIFAYDDCYPIGGLHDIVEDYDSFEAAKKACKKLIYNYVEIVKRDTWEIVWEK